MRRTKRISLLGRLALASLLLLVLQACGDQPAQDASTTRAVFTVWGQPKPVPAVGFVDGEGQQRSLADFKGRVALVNVWATWCAPCREEMPTLDRLQRQLGGAGLEVVALSVDAAGAPVVRSFYGDIGIQHLPLYVDSTAQAAITLDAIGLPTTILLDRQGREIARKLGSAEWDSPEVVEYLREVIEQPDQPKS
jgi:thiol-disulfide isomerase/thioredoxin